MTMIEIHFNGDKIINRDKKNKGERERAKEKSVALMI